jgi:hypothetical protein
MSDYLNNLVARTLNVAPVVQPRLASFFESGSTAAGVISRGPIEVETYGNDPSGEPKFRAPAAEPANVQPSQLPLRVKENIEVNLNDLTKAGADLDPGNPENSPAVVTHQLSPLPEVRGLRAPVAGRLTSQEPEALRNQQVTREQTTAPAAAKESGRSLIIERDREESRPPLQPGIRQLVDEALTRLQPARRDGNERTKPEQSGPVAVPTSRTSTERPDVVAIKPTPHIIREPVAATEPAPTINVTIGRVDVRAIISSPAETPRVGRAPRATATSLDEYLKQRSEGRR